MVPDIVLFFPIVDYAQTHCPLGTFTTCLPIGVAIFLLFDTVMRGPLLALLPSWFQTRIDPLAQLPTTTYLKPHFIFYTGLVAAIVIGAFTHQVWDAFTHKGRWGTNLVPLLNTNVSIVGYDVPGYKLFQYGSTFIGMPLLTLATMFLLNRIPTLHRATAVSLNLKLVLLGLICLIPLLVGAFAMSSLTNGYQILGVTIKRSGAIILMLLVAYCVGAKTLTNGKLYA